MYAIRSYYVISAWGDEVKALAGSLSEREGKVPMALVHFGTPTISFGQTYEHPIADTLYAERGGRGFSLVADGRIALVATFFEDGHVEGAWSKNPGFVLLAEDYIKHDIYIMKIVRRFNQELEGKFGPGYAALRLFINNWRWKGVPFYLRSGKRMARRISEIAVQFKP